jgi:GNAT superfamily N-acetyltransferase
MNTWSITCFFIQPNYQRQNISLKLLKEAIKYACSQGAEVVEGYPVEPKNDNGKQNFKISYRFMGFISTFRQAGFKDVTPEGHKRTIMRYTCRNSQIPG